jgi:hypothetical protein
MVPSIRGLRELEPLKTATEQPQGTPWNATRGTIFSTGLFVALIAALFSGYHGYWFFVTTRTEDPAAIQLQQEHHNIDHLSAADAVQLFRQEEEQGLGEPNPPFWTEIDKKHESSRYWGIIGMIVVGVGLLASASSMIGSGKKNG